MRRLLLVAGIQAALIASVLAGPASAKGWEHSRLTLRTDGLSGEIVRRGENAWTFIDEMGVRDAKWDAPNVGGTLDPKLAIGDAYLVRVILECQPAELSTFAMSLYPRADGGPQLFIEREQTLCDGTTVEPGWWPLRSETLRPFYRLGLARPFPAKASTMASPASVAGLAASTPISPPLPAAAWFVGGLVVLVLLGGIGFVVRRTGGRR
jgi:hypothetical protein